MAGFKSLHLREKKPYRIQYTRQSIQLSNRREWSIWHLLTVRMFAAFFFSCCQFSAMYRYVKRKISQKLRKHSILGEIFPLHCTHGIDKPCKTSTIHINELLAYEKKQATEDQNSIRNDYNGNFFHGNDVHECAATTMRSAVNSRSL